MDRNLRLAGVFLVALAVFVAGRVGWKVANAQRDAGTVERYGKVMPLPASLQGQPAAAGQEAGASKPPQTPTVSGQAAQTGMTPQGAQSSQQSAASQGQSSTGMQMPMMCGMMGGMGNMGTMGNMSGMGNSSLSHNMDQGLTMREILYIVSMQDTLQAMQDMVRIQEKLVAGVNPDDRDSIRKEMDQINDRLKKLVSDYRGIITSRVRGE